MREVTPQRTNGFAVSRDLTARLVPVSALGRLGRETRNHPPGQIKKLARNLEQFGFVLPIVIDPKSRVVAGWALVQAAKMLRLPEVPAVTVADLSDAQLRVLRLALIRLGEGSSWNPNELALEFGDLLQLDSDLDLTLTGFETGEIDFSLSGGALDEEDEVPVIDEDAEPVTKPGDFWRLGENSILCGDALASESYGRLLGEEQAEMVISDPPYNVSIPGHASGLGAVKHADFRMASGEMTPEEFVVFLQTSLGHAAQHSIDGSIHFLFMDWRHQREILMAGAAIYTELKNVCVWRKSVAGMGSSYRSQHEFVYVFKKGIGPHINSVCLGRNGRNRSNVWDYPSQNALNLSAKSKLSLHPTVKPVALVADAIRDCSNRSGIILDPFSGAGTTIIAAERTGRRARLIEIEPRFVDVTVRRWLNLTGGNAVHANTGQPYGH